MKKEAKERLEDAGWAVGNANDFHGLSLAEAAQVDIGLALGDEVRASGKRTHLTPQAPAKLIGSCQSRSPVDRHEGLTGTNSGSLTLRESAASREPNPLISANSPTS